MTCLKEAIESHAACANTRTAHRLAQALVWELARRGVRAECGRRRGNIDWIYSGYPMVGLTNGTFAHYQWGDGWWISGVPRRGHRVSCDVPHGATVAANALLGWFLRMAS